jgi:hypothetical protein
MFKPMLGYVKKFLLQSIIYGLKCIINVYFFLHKLLVPVLRHSKNITLLNDVKLLEYTYLGNLIICCIDSNDLNIDEYNLNKTYICNVTLMYSNGDGIVGLHEYDITEYIRRFSLYFGKNSLKWRDVLQYITTCNKKLDNYRFNKQAELHIYKNDNDFTCTVFTINDIHDKHFNIFDI